MIRVVIWESGVLSRKSKIFELKKSAGKIFKDILVVTIFKY